MLLTPPLTPQTPAEYHGASTAVRPIRYQRRSPRVNFQLDGDVSPDFILPPPMEPVPLELPEPSLAYDCTPTEVNRPYEKGTEGEWNWTADMSVEERDQREKWLAGGRGRRGVRIVIVTGELHIPRTRLMNQRTFCHVSTASLGPLRVCWSIYRKRDISVCC